MVESSFAPFNRYGNDHAYPTNSKTLNVPVRNSVRFSGPPSAVSPGTERKILRHLEAGNPLYLGIDPTYRDSYMATGHPPGCAGEGKGAERNNCMWEGKRARKVLKVATCGVSLDFWAKIILTVGMVVAGIQLLDGMNRFIQHMETKEGFNVGLTAYLIAWGMVFGVACLFGMILMWGKLRRSPTAALLFTIAWSLVTIILIVNAFLWFSIFFSYRAQLKQECQALTVSIGKPKFGFDFAERPKRAATQAEIDKCIQKSANEGQTTLIWGSAYTVFTYFACIVIFWGRNYRRRLLEIRAREEWIGGGSDVEKRSEKVGLVLGTAPMGMMGIAGPPDRVLGPRKASLVDSGRDRNSTSGDSYSRYIYGDEDSLYFPGNESAADGGRVKTTASFAKEPSKSIPRGNDVASMKRKDSVRTNGGSFNSSPDSDASGSSNVFKPLPLPPPPKPRGDLPSGSASPVVPMGLGISVNGGQSFV
ncbi:hypothetical protein RUND412_006247 [Rhizina undulata]